MGWFDSHPLLNFTVGIGFVFAYLAKVVLLYLDQDFFQSAKNDVSIARRKVKPFLKIDSGREAVIIATLALFFDVFVTTAVVFLYNRYDHYTDFLLFTTFVITTIVIIVIDVRYCIIPDSMQVLLLAIGLVYNYLYIQEDLIGKLTAPFFLISSSYFLKHALKLFYKKDAIGVGDIKLLFVSGFFLQPGVLPVFAFLVGLFGFITGLTWMVMRREPEFPFAPAVLLALAIVLFFPEAGDIYRVIYHMVG